MFKNPKQILNQTKILKPKTLKPKPETIQGKQLGQPDASNEGNQT